MGSRRLLVAWVLWACFSAYCVGGFPPCVDLAAHGAQLQSMVGLLRGDPTLTAVYELHFPLGYGLPFWLFLPVAALFDGAVAVRIALWVSLQLFALSVVALLRAFGRPASQALLGLPLAFNLSYWYGLLSGHFAQAFVFFGLAAGQRALALDPASSIEAARSRRRWLVWLNLAAGAAMLSHLIAFAALAVALAALGAAHLWLRPAGKRLGAAVTVALGLTLPALLSLPKVWQMATRAVAEGPWPATVYDAAGHVSWFFRYYRPEGLLSVAGPLAVTAVLVGVVLARRHVEPVTAALPFAALGLLYLVTPKTLSGIFLVANRLPVLAAVASLLLVDLRSLPKWLQGSLVAISLWSLGETALFHHRFARAVDGLESLVAAPPPARHGYVSLVGKSVLGARHPYLNHLGNWWTARHGGIGHDFFADAEHHPVRFRPGVSIPAELYALVPGELEQFEQLLVYGEGPLPPALAGWTVLEQVGPWRKVQRR